MATINAAWHAAHRMPKNPTPEQRIAWHLAHAANCACRAPTPGVLELMRSRGIEFPSPPKAAVPGPARKRAAGPKR